MYIKVLLCFRQGGEALSETYKGEKGVIILRELPWVSSLFLKSLWLPLRGYFFKRRSWGDT